MGNIYGVILGSIFMFKFTRNISFIKQIAIILSFYHAGGKFIFIYFV